MSWDAFFIYPSPLPMYVACDTRGDLPVKLTTTNDVAKLTGKWNVLGTEIEDILFVVQPWKF